MTDAEIDTLIKARNAITDRRDLDFNPDTGSIDAQLATVPPGQRNDVDLLLGRSGAVLPERPQYQRNEQRTAPATWFVSQAVTLEEIARQQRIFEQLEAVKKDWLAIRGDTDL